jgi:predicted AAA+ superfamily ATPase
MSASLRRVKASRWDALFDRVASLLVLAEQALRDLVGAAPGADGFEKVHAFRWVVRAGRGRLIAIEEPQRFDLGDLVGVDRAVSRLVANTEQFLAGHSSNHVLLYGERGTGKSSAVKGLLTRYAHRGLRLVEIHKRDLRELPEVLEALRGSPHRFLLFCDDLSFDAGETGFRELKAALEGSLIAPPANVRIVATSNRRHLLPESVSDNRDARLDEHGDLHMGETVDEKLALSDRFGLALGFYPFDQATFLAIVDHYARNAGVRANRQRLHEEALRFALDRSSRSGRTARHFVDDFAGREALARDAGSA